MGRYALTYSHRVCEGFVSPTNPVSASPGRASPHLRPFGEGDEWSTAEEETVTETLVASGRGPRGRAPPGSVPPGRGHQLPPPPALTASRRA